MVDIRRQELALRGQAMTQEDNQFAQKQAERAKESAADNEIAKDRINVQKEIADDKLDLGLDRLEQQAELKLAEMNQKMRG